MIECYECGYEIDEEEDIMHECPFCGREEISGEGFLKCPNCGELFDFGGDKWECYFCYNNGETDSPYDDSDECPSCGATIYGECCEECGWPDVNQGWLGENY